MTADETEIRSLVEDWAKAGAFDVTELHTMGMPDSPEKTASRCRTTVRASIHELITAPITPFKRQSPTLLLS